MLGSLAKHLMSMQLASSSQPYFSTNRVSSISNVTPCSGSWLLDLVIRSAGFGFGFFDANLAAVHFLAVQQFDSRLGFAGFGHLDEAKAFG